MKKGQCNVLRHKKSPLTARRFHLACLKVGPVVLCQGVSFSYVLNWHDAARDVCTSSVWVTEEQRPAWWCMSSMSGLSVNNDLWMLEGLKSWFVVMQSDWERYCKHSERHLMKAHAGIHYTLSHSTLHVKLSDSRVTKGQNTLFGHLTETLLHRQSASCCITKLMN